MSGALATLSIIGLSYLSSRFRTTDLQAQINSLQNSVNSLQNSVISLQSQISTLSSSVSSASTASSAVLDSTCNTVSKFRQFLLFLISRDFYSSVKKYNATEWKCGYYKRYFNLFEKFDPY